MARQVQIRCNDADPGLKHHYHASSYVGKTIAEVLGLTFDRDKQKIAEILKTWIKNDVLAVVDEIDKRQSRDVKVVRSGSVNPLVVG